MYQLRKMKVVYHDLFVFRMNHPSLIDQEHIIILIGKRATRIFQVNTFT